MTPESFRSEYRGSIGVPTPSRRLSQLPTYVFAELDRLKAEARAQGIDLIDLGMGNPDNPTPEGIFNTIVEACQKPENHRYPEFKGKQRFREAVCRWMDRRYGVQLDAETEIQPLIGSKEGLAHLTFAYINFGDFSLVPSPYYPVHARATWLSGGEVYHLPLKPETNYLPDLDAIPEEVAQKAKLLFISYPNNPTTAVADFAFYEKVVKFCKDYGILAVSDLAYGELTYDGLVAPSILSVPGAKDIAVEFHSFSKTFNMAGWRVGFAAGNAEVIKNLYSLKTNLDYGLNSSIQEGAIYALDHAEELIGPIRDTYQRRRDIVEAGFHALGWPIRKSKATMYIWLPVPAGFNSYEWCRHLIDQAGVVITPGMAFGKYGEGYFRVSLVSPDEVLLEGLQRLRDKGITYQQ